jgi:hypothetical protein
MGVRPFAKITQTPYLPYQHWNSARPPAWPVTDIIQMPKSCKKNPIA